MKAFEEIAGLSPNERAWTTTEITISYRPHRARKLKTKTVEGLLSRNLCWALVPVRSTHPEVKLCHDDKRGQKAFPIEFKASHKVGIWLVFDPEDPMNEHMDGVQSVFVGFARCIEEANAYILQAGGLIRPIIKGAPGTEWDCEPWAMSALTHNILMPRMAIEFLCANSPKASEFEFLHEGYDIPEHIADYEAESDWRKLV